MEILPAKPSSKAPEEQFTGDVWVDTITQGEALSRLRAAVVRFSPSARTAWHRHAAGQILHVTQGIGLVQSRGGQAVVMRPGDTIYTPPGEWHWHGSAPDRFMTHFALSQSTGDPAVSHVDWGEHITDDEYQNALPNMTE